MAEASALFIHEDDHFIPTDLTRGGWSDESQHGGPPSGLLAREIELVPTAAPMQVVRFTIDLFRPVPLEPLRVEHHVLRDGRRIQVVAAVLLHRDVEVGRATALKIRTAEVELPEVDRESWEQPPPPDQATGVEMLWPGAPDLRRFHLHGIDVRTLEGSFLRMGPGLSWFRLKYPVVEGETPTRFLRLATLADMANGNSQALDPSKYIYVNPDITIYASRPPEGEWVGMASAAQQHPSGIGLADTQLFDTAGRLGRISQAQLVDYQPRRETVSDR